MIQEEPLNVYVWNATIQVLILCSLIVVQGSFPSFKVVQFTGKIFEKFIKSRWIFFICPSPMIQEEPLNMKVWNDTIMVLILCVS
jgi:hypothetical protein